jgi:hypothetical protein
MKRTTIDFDAASVISDLLGVPEGSSWQSASAPADDTGAASAVTTASAVESGIDAHAPGIDLHVAAPESDALSVAPASASSTDADIRSIWASPSSQPAETPITSVGDTVVASQAQEANTDPIDPVVSAHDSAGLPTVSFASVVSAPSAPASVPPLLALAANHAGDSFGFALGTSADAGAMPQHAELPDAGAHTSAAAPASLAVTALPGDFAMLANPPASLDGPVANGQVGSGGATAAQVQQALDESGLSVNGSGIKVGVLSDSFNDLGGAAADEVDGALPSASNIEVLKDYASGGTDEGRAMMQIVHDIAPGASLAFYTAFDSEQDFANGILALAAAGCKVICDDVGYFDEPFFQNGIIAQAIQTVEAEGVTYVTAAGNEASNGYQAAWTPIAHTSYDGYALSDVESFGGSAVQTISVGGNVPLIVEWNQPYGGATSNLEILAFQNGNLVGVSESEAASNNPWAGIELSAGTYQIAIENLSGPNPGLIKEITFGDGIPVAISGANAGTVYGHAMTPGAITAGAVSAADTPAFGFSPSSESFSSSGAGTELLFANNGTALWPPDVLSPVAVSGIDDIETSVPGGLSDFYGTSAASASLAGVAALMLSANPSLTPAQVEQIMEETALPMSNAAVSGAGLVQVDAAVAAAMPGPDVTVANLTLSQVSVAASSLFSVSDSSGYSITEYGFEDTGSGHFVLNGVAQADNREIDVTAAQLSQLTYQSVLGAADTIEVRAADQNGWSSWASFVATAPALVIQTDTSAYGSTSLAETVNHYFLYAAGTTTGPELDFNGTPVTVGEFAGWAPIGAVQTAGGYDVAWALSGGNGYSVWSVNSNGNWTGILLAADVPRSSLTLESLETTFGQDLNGDGAIGAPTTLIQTDTSAYGTTSLTQIANQYFLNSGGADPALSFYGSPVTAGEFAGWSPIGAVRTANGYDVAWKLVGGNEYSVWSVNSNGNFTGLLAAAVAGTNVTLESLETVFGQDLNGDGTIGPKATVIQTDTGAYGTTSLMEIGNAYFLYSGGSGPAVSFFGTPVADGEFNGWAPIGAVQTASGYDMAWKLVGGDGYSVWSVDNKGNFTGLLAADVSGTSMTLESLESVFGQDLNGDGVTGVKSTLIQTDTGSHGSTSLTQSANEYFLDSNGSGPALSFLGSLVLAGEFTGWAPIGAVQTTSGYDVAWKLVGGDGYSVWSVDSNGNFTGLLTADVPGTNQTLESLESVFGQDLNGDGVVGLYAARGATMQISQALTRAAGAATIGAGDSLELTATDSAAISFAAATGMLKLDHPSTFTGEIFGFTGNGQLSGSDQIDLKGISDSTVQDSYANGVLTVTDGTNTAHLSFSGSYVLGNFKFADDGSGGTIVYDPPVPNAPAAGTSASVSTDHGNDAFVFHPNLGQGANSDQVFQAESEHFDPAAAAAPAFAMAHDVHASLVVADVAHDAITFHHNALMQMHHSGFVI